MYTAIHELAHHVVDTEYGQRKARSHTKLFWATFHNLLETAEKKGVYVRDRPAAIKELAEKARKIDRSIAKLQRELGVILSDLQELCEEAGERYEDVVEHDIGMARLTAKKVQEAASILVDGEIGQDAQALALRAGSAAKQAAVIEQAEEGKSIAQIEELARPRPRVVGRGGLEDAITMLQREKRRIEGTILVLSHRLENVTRELKRAEEEETAGVAG
jgi:prefoldin subunit 5